MKKIARRVKILRSIFDNDRIVVYHGDCLKVIASMPEASVDTIVTDPPYNLGFMGKTWDIGGIAFDPETWRAALRVAKPGAHLVAFGGTRTHHRLACAIEDAGWKIRDCLMWVYGSGFPKSLDVSKAIDKAAGVERQVLGTSIDSANRRASSFQQDTGAAHGYVGNSEGERTITAPATGAAAHWQGWGTALKPSWEPIILARKPLDGTVAECALRHGTGALNVDGCRIAGPVPSVPQPKFSREMRAGFGASDGRIGQMSSAPRGRWPPNAVFQHDARCVRVSERKVKTAITVRRNVGKGGSKFFGMPKDISDKRDVTYGDASGLEIVDLYACVPGCPVRMLDEQSGESKSPKTYRRNANSENKRAYAPGIGEKAGVISQNFGDSGSASRFFYTPKASTAERVLGCPPGYQNLHPTVKPLDLCRWLCRLTKTPTGGVVLDPFSGSGSIVVAALLEGRGAIAIELEEESANVTVARVQAALKYGDELQRLKRYKLRGRKKLRRRHACEE